MHQLQFISPPSPSFLALSFLLYVTISASHFLLPYALPFVLPFIIPFLTCIPPQIFFPTPSSSSFFLTLISASSFRHLKRPPFFLQFFLQSFTSYFLFFSFCHSFSLSILHSFLYFPPRSPSSSYYFHLNLEQFCNFPIVSFFIFASRPSFFRSRSRPLILPFNTSFFPSVLLVIVVFTCFCCFLVLRYSYSPVFPSFLPVSFSYFFINNSFLSFDSLFSFVISPVLFCLFLRHS